ncbi:SidA/IucD/PvdA family monooxygenase [Amycolatopsis sp. lyj-23]|uniref:SidA/IucD/PvdA family monooxygenase n=1 Tax=Amycolatopsis sp. lyj-23 TaxID=2789283 RepID=UPI00397E2140
MKELWSELPEEGQPVAEQNAYDVVGVGFGPSNLALAVAAHEIDPGKRCLFVERRPEFEWHPGMLLDDTRMQISFLKDLVLLRNLDSKYSFLSYLKHHGRLEQFVNLNDFHPSRIEYSDYLKWVAADFAGQVRYGAQVTRVAPWPSPDGMMPLFEVECRDVSSGDRRTVLARNVVVAPGGRPRVFDDAAHEHVIHSSEFIPRFSDRVPDPSAAPSVLVVGSGQSAGEITKHILERYPNASVRLLVSGYSLRPTDNSLFVNEQFFSDRSLAFRRQLPGRRARQLAELSAANYGVVEGELLDEIYRLTYRDAVRGRQRLIIHSYAKLTGIRRDDDGIVAVVQDRLDGRTYELTGDVAVLATGYERELDEHAYADVLPFVKRDDLGKLLLTENHRVVTAETVTGGLYVQGLGEHAFGIGESLLSMLPFRSKQIFDDLRARDAGPVSDGGRRRPEQLYPPARHLEDEEEKLYRVIERYKFATVVSAHASRPLVTQVPLILDRGAGGKGTLRGHFDRANPQAALLDGRPTTVVFSGPNSYIAPTVYRSAQLPTWNSVAVHVSGRARVIHDREQGVDLLCRIAEFSDRSAQPWLLSPDDPRIDALIDRIVAFEIEIVTLTGRFKLSQDRDLEDRRRAADALANTAEAPERDFIAYLADLARDEHEPGAHPCNGAPVDSRESER